MGLWVLHLLLLPPLEEKQKAHLWGQFQRGFQCVLLLSLCLPRLPPLLPQIPPTTRGFCPLPHLKEDKKKIQNMKGGSSGVLENADVFLSPITVSFKQEEVQRLVATVLACRGPHNRP